MDAMSGMAPPAADARLHRLLLVLLAVLVLAGLVPLCAAGIVYRFFHSGRVFALAALALAGAALPALLALRAARRTADAGDAGSAAALWSACLVAVVTALLAVTCSAQTVLPWLVVQAQRNTHPYAVTQPLALLVLVIGVALAIDRARLRAVLAGRLATPVMIAKGVVAGFIVAVWFLEGGAGPHPGPWWLAAKTAIAGAVIVAVAMRLERSAWGGRFVIAWITALAGCLNLLGTLAVLALIKGGQ